ncbi:MAG: hypothetical protein HDR00_09290 [Lachnospiraceae bacterium]|nr:hypothetical protein [Lachnospiraceae bacterium]
MRLEGSVVDALVMTKKEQENSREPGNFFYRIGIVKDEELGELSCTKEVFDEVEKMHSYDFGFRFNSEYKSLQLDRVLRGYGTLEQQATNKAIAESIAAVPESAEAEEKKEESSAATKSSKK